MLYGVMPGDLIDSRNIDHCRQRRQWLLSAHNDVVHNINDQLYAVDITGPLLVIMVIKAVESRVLVVSQNAGLIWVLLDIYSFKVN